MTEKITPEVIVTECCNLFCVPEAEIKQQSRKQERVVCRAFIAHFIKKNVKISLPRIGEYIGRDHSNVIHLLDTIDVYRKMDILYARYYDDLMQKFGSNEPTGKTCPNCGHNI